MKKLTIVILALSILLVFAFAEDEKVKELTEEQKLIIKKGTELLNSVDKNLSPPSYESYRKIINIEPNGFKKEFVMYSVKKGRDKMALAFLEPKSEVGRVTLRVNENMWLYIPNVGRPIRITSLQSVTGGLFNNSDIMTLDYGEEYNVENMEEDEKETILILRAKTSSVAYDKLKMWVDVKDKLPTKIECYSASDMLIKTLEFKDIKEFEKGLKRPSVTETYSPLHKGYKSIMIFAKMKKRELEDEVFTVDYMPKVPDLRK